MATEKLKLFLVLLCVFVFVVAVQCLDVVANANRQNVNAFIMHHNTIDSDFRKITKRSNRFRRAAVGVGDEICQSQEVNFLTGDKTDFSYNHALKNETKYSMALVWPGHNDGKILMVTTEEFFMFARPSTLYRSDDYGKTFTNINDLVGEGTIIRKGNGLQKNVHRDGSAFLIAHTQYAHSRLWITKDSGATFKEANVDFLIDGELTFHPKPSQSNLILVLSNNEQALYLSQNGGFNWTRIKDQVASVRWTTNPDDQDVTIYLKASSPGLLSSIYGMAYNDYTIEKSTNLGTTWTVLHKHVYSMGLQGKYLYCSFKRDPDNTRIMEVSTDSGANWNEVQLPAITADRFYAILDMSEGEIFMHVDDPGDTGHGTLFTSDATGIVFSESLSKHLYPNFHDITDFYRVASMRGVFLASQIQDDNSIRTRITFNRGADWHSIPRPANAACKDETKTCTLHIHNSFSQAQGVIGQQPLSVESAVGLILVHGHVAESMQVTQPDVFVTSDGGYHWSLALKGPHYYQIADQGGLLVAVSIATTTPNIVKFSTDEGRCWHEYQFTNKTVIFTGLLTEPGNKAMSVAIWGYTRKEREWQVFTVDFNKVIQRQCEDTDYESWIAHFENSNEEKYKGCLLGIKETFQRLKKDSWCYNGHGREVKRAVQELCECTNEDYQCDYGYMRDSVTDQCIEDATFVNKQLDICLRGHLEKIVTEGYHKIPGDQCTGGFTPAGSKRVDLDEACKEGDKAILMGHTITTPAAITIKKKSNVTAIVFAALFIMVVAIAMAVLFVKRTSVWQSIGSVSHSRLSSPFSYRQFDQTGSVYDVQEDQTSAPVGSYGGMDAHATTVRPATNTTNGGGYGVGAAPVVPRSRADIPVLSAIPPSSATAVKSYHDDSDVDLLE